MSPLTGSPVAVTFRCQGHFPSILVLCEDIGTCDGSDALVDENWGIEYEDLRHPPLHSQSRRLTELWVERPSPIATVSSSEDDSAAAPVDDDNADFESNNKDGMMAEAFMNIVRISRDDGAEAEGRVSPIIFAILPLFLGPKCVSSVGGGRGFNGSDGKGRARREATSPPISGGTDDGLMAGRVPRPP
ncbi:hypothetical protein B0H14DRAFT_2640352 [Mycena olivaceomarginata]|nr:hypothetical protein B0H14DRAFT_2640352 [Mycena olivaceomarginata]